MTAKLSNVAIDISKHPLIKQAYDVCQAIEKCGASPELTDAVTKACALMQGIANAMDSDPVALAGFDAASAIRSCMEEFPEHVHDIVEECAQIAENTISTRHAAPPAPVAVPDDAALRILFEKWFAADCAFDESPSATEEDNLAWKEDYWHVWKACRTAMLKGENHEQ